MPCIRGVVAEAGSAAAELVDDEVPDLTGEPLSPDELTEALAATSDSLADDGVTGELVEAARDLDLAEVEPGEELTELRTVDSRTFLEEDRTLRTELGSEPMFAEDAAGDLVEMDAMPRGARDERWRPTAGRPGVSFGSSAADQRLGSMSFDAGQSIAWSLDGAAPVAGQRQGDGVVYDGVFEGVDVVLESSLVGVKETIVIHNASAPTVYDFPLNLIGLVAELDDPYGSIVLADSESSEPVGVIPSAWAQDSSLGPRGETPDPGLVAYELVGDGPDAVLRVSVDERWFNDPARLFPVLVDPTLQDFRIAGDTWVHDHFPTTNRSTSPLLKTGGGGGNHRTYFARWDLGWLTAATILDAQYSTFNSYSWSCTPAPLQVYRVTSNWNPATVTWGTQPSFSGLLGAHNVAYGRPGCPARWLENPMRDTVQRWVDGVWPAYGVTGRVHPNDSYNSDATYKEFASSEAANGGGQSLVVVWSPWRVRYQVASALTPPTASQTGSIQIDVTNKAPTTWRATGTNRYRLGYHVYEANGTTLVDWVGGVVDLPQDVSWGERVRVTVPIGALPVGEYQIKFDMVQAGVDWFSKEGLHPDLTPLAIRVSVGNTPPGIQSASPAGEVDTRTPMLSVVGVNPDNFPSGGLAYDFKIREDEAMTTGCQTRDWSSDNRWSPPNLQWAATYWWNAAVREVGAGGLTTQPTWKAPLTPTVVQPRLERHFGSDPYAPFHGGVNPSVGNYVASFTDMHVASAGLPLEVTRTYNSMDTRVGAFGPGWSTFLDLSAEAEAGGKLLVSFPDGHQERYGQNPDGSWSPPAGNVSEVRSAGGGGWELERADGLTYVFDGEGRVVELRDGWGNALVLTRDVVSGRVEIVTNEVSGRYVDVDWAPVGPGGADVVSQVRTEAPGVGDPEPTWTYSYSDGRLTGVCAPGEPLPDEACMSYQYYGSGQGSAGRLQSITRQEGNVFVELGYQPDGEVAWVQDGADERWVYSDADDQAEGTYHPVAGFRAMADTTVNSGATRLVDVSGAGGVPDAGVLAVVVDVEVASLFSGWLVAYPAGDTMPAGVSTMDYLPGGR